MFLRFHLFVNWVFSWHGYLSLHLCHGDWQSEVCLCSSFLSVLAHRWKELGNFTNDGLSYSCSLLTFMWFQGNRNLVSDPLKLLFPQTIVIMSEIHCEVRCCHGTLIFLCWAGSLSWPTLTKEGQTRMCHRSPSEFSSSHLRCWEFV